MEIYFRRITSIRRLFVIGFFLMAMGFINPAVAQKAIPLRVYGSEHPLVKINDVALQGETVFVLTATAPSVHVFADNSYKSWGIEGKGPAEFINLRNVQITENRLFAYDSNQNKTVVFSLDDLSHSYNVIMDDIFYVTYYVRNNGTFLKKETRISNRKEWENWDKVIHTGTYYLLNKEGQVISDTLFEMRSHIRVMVPTGRITTGRPVGMYAKSVTALSDDNHIYQARTGDFLIKVYGPNGEYQRAFYYPYERAPLTLASATAAGIAEFKLKGFDMMELPDTWPALNTMLIDDQSRLWIATITEDEQVYQWWVLDKQGKLLARFTWPRTKQIEAVKDGKLYVRETDEKTGLERIVRYDIKMK